MEVGTFCYYTAIRQCQCGHVSEITFIAFPGNKLENTKTCPDCEAAMPLKTTQAPVYSFWTDEEGKRRFHPGTNGVITWSNVES